MPGQTPGELTIPVALPSRGLTSNSIWALSGNLAYGGCQWLILLLLAKTGDPSMVGQFALGLAVTAPVFQFTNLQLRAAQVTDAQNYYAFGDYLGLRLLTSLVAVTFIAAVVLLEYHERTTAIMVLLIAIAKSVESGSDIFQGLFQKHEEMQRVALSMILKGALSVLMVGLAMFFFHSVAAAGACLVAAWASTVAAYDAPTGASMLPNWRRSLRPSFRRAVVRKLFVLTLPLGLAMMLISLNQNISRYFLMRSGGPRAVGIFSALAYCLVAGTTLINAVAQAASPRLAKHYANGELHAFRRILAKLALAVLAGGAIGAFGARLAGRQILELLYRPEYGQHADAFFWIVVGGTLASLTGVLGVGLTAMRVFASQLAVYAGCTAVGLAACGILIPQKGILGAAFVAVIMGATGLAGSATLMRYALSQRKTRPAESFRATLEPGPA